MGEIGELLVIPKIFQSFPRSVRYQTLGIVRRQAEAVYKTGKLINCFHCKIVQNLNF